MNISMIRKKLIDYIGDNHTFYYAGLRGQNEIFDGCIIHVYPRTFLVKTNNGILKSFSYSDFATKMFKIIQ